MPLPWLRGPSRRILQIASAIPTLIKDEVGSDLELIAQPLMVRLDLATHEVEQRLDSSVDCHIVSMVIPDMRKAAISPASSGAAIISQKMLVAPTAVATRSRISCGWPCNSIRSLPRERNCDARSARALARKCRRCAPARANPHGVTASGGWQ